MEAIREGIVFLEFFSNSTHIVVGHGRWAWETNHEGARDVRTPRYLSIDQYGDDNQRSSARSGIPRDHTPAPVLLFEGLKEHDGHPHES